VLEGLAGSKHARAGAEAEARVRRTRVHKASLSRVGLLIATHPTFTLLSFHPHSFSSITMMLTAKFLAVLAAISAVAAAPVANQAVAKRAAEGQADIDTVILNYALTLEVSD
jgi:multisubunit Na+/H+ antiporter MnhE subunit